MSAPHPYSYEPFLVAGKPAHQSGDAAGAVDIRILAIKPGDFNDPLCCNLDIISLLDCPVLRPYKALSYVWGDAGIKNAILVNEQELSITTNLEAALRHLRQQDSERTVWVNAICIDQGNIKERGAQVQLMSRIHQGAFFVIVWLGKADGDTDIAFDTAKRLDDIIKGESTAPILRPSRSRLLGENHFTDRQIDCFTKLFNDNTWFTRIWCVQEFGHGKSVELVCSCRSMPWKSLVLGTQNNWCWTLSNAEENRLANIQKRGGGLEAIKTSYNLASTSEYEKYRRFANLIQLSSEMSSTESRDKIYARLVSQSLHNAALLLTTNDISPMFVSRLPDASFMRAKSSTFCAATTTPQSWRDGFSMPPSAMRLLRGSTTSSLILTKA